MLKQLVEMCALVGVSEATAELCYDSISRHRAYVKEAGRKLGVPDRLLDIHDDSKFTANEFPAYARHFFGSECDIPDCIGVRNLELERAWLHHENHNPHHWGYWIPRSGSHAEHPLEMHPNYGLEMIADWMGASKEYTDSWDMTEWLLENLPVIQLHPATRASVDSTLTILGYKTVIEEVNQYCIG